MQIDCLDDAIFYHQMCAHKMALEQVKLLTLDADKEAMAYDAASYRHGEFAKKLDLAADEIRRWARAE